MPRYDLICTNCKNEQIDILHSIHDPHPPCSSCGAKNETLWNQSASVAGDECDIYIKNGLCWPDGTPRRFRSKAEIKKLAFEKGLFQGYDTPKPNQRLLEARQEAREKNR